MADEHFKTCTKCKQVKPCTAEFFHVYARSPDGRRSVCIECRAKDHALRKDENAVKRKAFYVANRERISAASRSYYNENADAQRELARNRHHKNRDVRLEKMRAYQAENRDVLLANKRKREQKRFNEMYGADVAFTLRHRMRSLFRGSLAKRKKSGRMEHLLGYGLDELRAHIERQFVGGMNWDRFMAGEIHLDHIVPIAAFDITSCECEEFKRCWALSNLRPMWARENLSKGAKVLTLI